MSLNMFLSLRYFGMGLLKAYLVSLQSWCHAFVWKCQNVTTSLYGGGMIMGLGFMECVYTHPSWMKGL